MMRHAKRRSLFRLPRQLALSVVFGSLLSNAAHAADSAPLPVSVSLDRTGNFVTKFLEDFSNVKCTELVSQAKLGKGGQVEYREEASFDYLVLAQSNGGELTLLESRLAGNAAKHTRNLPLLVTNGFSTLLLVFHPSYQTSFQYTPLEDEVVGGQRYARLHFRHIKGTRSTAVLLLRGREFPLDLEGTAWFDHDTGVIARLTAGLESGMEDIGLRALRCEVQYARVLFPGINVTSWLPTVAMIEVETPRQRWRNIHRFTAYQRFSTRVESRIAGNR